MSGFVCLKLAYSMIKEVRLNGWKLLLYQQDSSENNNELLFTAIKTSIILHKFLSL